MPFSALTAWSDFLRTSSNNWSVFDILLAGIGLGILMLGYDKLQQYLANRDDNEEGVDDLAAKIMVLGRGTAEELVEKLKALLEKKKAEEADKE